MKPIKLTMRGFMTYKDQIEIDFTKLYPKKIFLVSGDTGSGKTTIFDGISYALYGVISRGVSGKTLRSDFLTKDDPYTFVRLIFEIDGKEYFVERIPSQEANKEGKSINLNANTASFYEIGREKESLLSKVKEVDNKIKDIMGLDNQQFTKVMLLAQGQFQQFLSADSKVRSKLLGDIFKTQMYEKIQIDLKEKSKLSSAKLEQIYESLKAEIDRDEELGQIVDIGDVASRKFKPILDQVEEIFEQRSDNYKCIEKIRNEKGNAHTKLIRDREQIINDNENIKKLAIISSDLMEMETKESYYTDLRSSLDKATAAQNIKQFEERLEKIKANLEDKENSLKISQKSLAEVVDNLTSMQKNLDGLADKNKKVDDLKSQKIKLLEAKNELTEYQKKKADYLAIEDKLIEIENLYKTQDANKKELADFYESLDSKNKVLDKKKTDIRLREIDLNKHNENLRLVEEDIKIYEKNQELLSQIAANTDKVYELSTKKSDLERLLALYEQNQKLLHINELIDDLNQTGICPVCKVHHDVTFEKYPISEIDKIEIEREDVEKNLADISIEIAQIDERTKAYEAAIREIDDITKLEESLTNSKDIIKNLEADISGLNNEKYRLENETVNLRDVIGKTNDLISQNDNKIKNLNERTKDSENLKAYYQANKIRMEAMDEDQMDSDIKALGLKIAKLEEEIAEINITYNKLRIDEEKHKADIKNFENDILTISEDIKTYEADLADRISSEFADDTEYRNILSSYDELINKKLEIEDYFTKLNNLRITKATLKAYEGREIKDVSVIDTQVQLLNEQIEELNKNLSEIHHGILNITSIRQRIINLREEYSQIESNTEILGKLSEIANGESGQVAGRMKVKFETFVLTYYFDKVLNLANKRLDYMSKGQFKMIRSASATDNRKESGLDIEILDANTGKLRPAATLSGGESFLASLALALGLSDEISAESGGITIDTLFIDEGFGTLSDDYLIKVIEQIEMLSYENKFIGLISHVKDLKDSIDAKILVDYDQATGSSIRIIT